MSNLNTKEEEQNICISLALVFCKGELFRRARNMYCDSPAAGWTYHAPSRLHWICGINVINDRLDSLSH